MQISLPAGISCVVMKEQEEFSRPHVTFAAGLWFAMSKTGRRMGKQEEGTLGPLRPSYPALGEVGYC